jgi:hypothetical protein
MEPPSASVFPYAKWEAQLPDLAARYRQAAPFPHITLENFLEDALARRLAQEFPGPRETAWIHYKHYNENTLGRNKRDEFPCETGLVIDEFNSARFASFVSQLTGIAGLVADPDLDGAGMHQTEPGGFLNIHADFSAHHHQKQWRRRVNLILYLNPDWQPGWGGELEFWDRDMRACVTKIPPLLNRAVFFTTNELSFHGYPAPIKFPPGASRKSLALYYYTVETESNSAGESTRYRPLPGQGARSSFMIWADNQALSLYSGLKRKLGFSDDLAGKILGWFSRKK